MIVLYTVLNFVVAAAYVVLGVGVVFVLRALPGPRPLRIVLTTASALFLFSCGYHHAHVALHVAEDDGLSNLFITTHGLLADAIQAIAAPTAFVAMILMLKVLTIKVVATGSEASVEAVDEVKTEKKKSNRRHEGAARRRVGAADFGVWVALALAALAFATAIVSGSVTTIVNADLRKSKAELSQLESEIYERRDQTCLIFERQYNTAVRRVSNTYTFLDNLDPEDRGTPLIQAIIRNIPQTVEEAKAARGPKYCDPVDIGLAVVPPQPPELRDYSQMTVRP